MDFLKSCIIFCTVLVKIKACLISYDDTMGLHQCILTCTDYINNDVLKLGYHPYYGYSDKCRTMIDGEAKLYISELIYKPNFVITSSIPLTSGNNVRNILDAINSLNLSNNDLNSTPSIQSMKNLKLINLSRNNLTTAVLSNNYELRLLSEIDFSYNIITDIKVNNNGHIYYKLTKINISHNQLTEIPEAVFDGFRDLEILDFSFNNIERLSVATFEGVRKLLELNLSNNRITSVNSSLFRFSELNFLDLSVNQIENLQANDFQQLSMLCTLDLSSNILKVINVNVFQNTLRLKTLNLSNNLLQIIEPNSFSSLQLLSSIDLAKNELKSLPTGLFKHTNILEFSINDNKFEGSIVEGMFEGINVTKLDLSNQFLTELKDYAFQNIDSLNELFLNYNNISLISIKCFKTLVNLKQLDLSHNKITNIDFDKKDLINLQSLLLKNNRIIQIKYEDIEPLTSLVFLDISENLISHLASNLFQSLKELINLEISNNPFVGTIETGTFEGLVSLPSLDISHSMLTAIRNSSFTNMHSLKELNVSYGALSELEYNIFINTGSIETLDLSYNKLTDFSINTTELGALSILFLNNNLIKTISSPSLNGMSWLKQISLSHNVIENMPCEASPIHLQYLDLSFNEKLNFSISMLRKSNSLNTLILSGIKIVISFKYMINDSSVANLIISNASIFNISQLYINKMVNLASLDLSFNNVSKLQVGDFNSLRSLTRLDLTFNKIFFIQPGVFKDNVLLNTLNISHNCISSIRYGIFRGLNSLKVLDLSYNKIKDLQSERFYEVKHLTQLIVDFNQIDSINSEVFAGTSLSKLSIGNNPIDCQILVKLYRTDIDFEITAIRIDEHSNDNVNGVICNKESKTTSTSFSLNNNENSSILKSLSNILEKFNDKGFERDALDSKYLEKISNSLDKLSQVLIINSDTNIMLSKLIKLLNQTSSAPVLTTSVTPVIAVTRRTTYKPTTTYISNVTQTVDFISYVSHIKKELENTIAIEKQNIISQIESKLRSNSNQSEFLPTNIDHSQLVSNKNEVPSFLFVETYIALILSVTLVCMLVVLLLYRVYKSKLRANFSVSNHVLPGAMDNSSL